MASVLNRLSDASATCSMCSGRFASRQSWKSVLDPKRTKAARDVSETLALEMRSRRPCGLGLGLFCEA